ncbi:MAG: CpaF family protein [Candidatus Hydrogenedentota bacterium]
MSSEDKSYIYIEKSIFQKDSQKKDIENIVALDTGERLKVLEEIEETLPFIHISRPSTDEYLDSHKKELRKFLEIKKTLLNTLIENLEHNLIEKMSEFKRRAFLKEKILFLINEFLFNNKIRLSKEEKDNLLLDLEDEIYGLGPIEQLMRDENINEIMVNGPQNIFVERNGRSELTPLEFYDAEHLLSIIRRIISPLGKRIDESNPMVDARLPDGSRINAVISPIALDGPLLTIRKFSKTPIQMLNLIQWGSINETIATFLSCCVRGRLNIIVSGGTGSGKTTLLNILGSFIPPDERIITIEDSAELKLWQYHKHVVRMETRPANIEDKGEISIRTLVRNSLRMRPDRIIVGEVRGAEAYDMLQAMNTGHDGSISTGHANSPKDMLTRLEAMVMMAVSEVPLAVVRKQISSAIDLIVHIERLPDGTRKLTYVTEVGGINKKGEIQTNDIFQFIESGIDADGKILGRHQPTGYKPTFIEKLKRRGIEITI